MAVRAPAAGDGGKSLMDKHAKRISVQDGINKTALREWIEEISSAKEWCNASEAVTLYTVGYLVKGRLDLGIRRWIRDFNNPGTEVSWEYIKNQIAIEFLDADEAEHLRRKLTLMKQSGKQDVKEFSREFDQAVHLAYTDIELAVPLILEMVVRAFITSLRDENVKMLVHMGRPLTLKAAYEAGRTADRARTLATEVRTEEPMEVGATRTAPTPPPNPKQQDSASLVQTIDLLTKNLKAMEARLNKAESVHPMRRGRGNGPVLLKQKGSLTWTEDGRPICYRCQRPGHMAKDRICQMSPGHMPNTGN